MDKKLAKKLAKMSEEERAQFLEQKRLAEEEEKRIKEESLLRFLKNKLSKEEEASKVNVLKLQEQWRTIMRKTKADELRQDVQVLQETFERQVDRKDAILHSLVRDIEESEEQYHMSLRSHIENVDKLIEFQAKRIHDLELSFQQDVDAIKKEFDTERQQIIEHHEREISDLKDILYAMKLRFNERESEAEQEFQGLMDELKNKNLEETHSLSAQRKATLDELWEEFQQETKHYRENTEEKKLRFEALKKKDEQSAREIAQQNKRLDKLQATIKDLRAKMSSNLKEHEARVKTIKEDKEMIQSHFAELRNSMMKSREEERNNLTTLTLQSDAAIKKLQTDKEMGEKILRLAEMCRKLETEEEKVLPFYTSTLTAQEEDQVKSVSAGPVDQPLAQVLHDYSSMENFWRRYNKVHLDQLALEKEKSVLEEENQKLRMLLKQYLDGISVSDEVLSHKNPLLVVNSRKTPQFPVSDPRVQRKQPVAVTVVEAAHVLKNSI